MLKRQSSSGFSLLELMISLALLLVIAGAVIGSLLASQKNYRGQQIKISLDQQMRSALELMSSEVGQAGLPLSRLAGSNTAISDNALVVQQAAGSLVGTTGSPVLMTGLIPVNSNSTIFPFYINQRIVVDTKGVREESLLAAVDPVGKTITGPFVNIHNGGDAIFSEGLYPDGVLWVPNTYTAKPSTVNVYTGYELWLFGDITNQGSLDLISYVCNGNTNQLIRTTYDTSHNACSGGKPSKVLGYYKDVVLLDNVLNCNTNANAPPFTLVASPNPGTPNSYTFVTSVSVSIQMQSMTNDPQTNQPVILTKSFLNIQPRNILAAYTQLPIDTDFQENPQYGAFSCFPTK